MKTSELILASLNITEDEYNYKALFILKQGSKSVNCDMANIENDLRMKELKEFFSLDEDIEDIRKILINKIHEKANNLVSKINEGENYEEKHLRHSGEKAASSMDMA